MAENSGDRSTDDVETLRARIAQLQTLLGEERAKREQAEEALQKARSDLDARVRDQTLDPTEPDRRVQEEIRKRKRVKVALQDSEALYHSLVENLPICVYRIDLEGRLTFGNSAYLKDLGRSLDELLGKTVFDMFPEEQAKKYDIKKEFDVRRYLEYGIGYGSDFDTNPETSWANKILNDNRLGGSKKMDRLDNYTTFVLRD